MTTTELAQQTLSDAQIQQRIRLNQQAGWGLEKGTSAQLNMVFLICQKYDLLPGEDLTLYDGKPWITIDGRVKLMRRHAEYRGYSTRPLTSEEKELWGYDVGDLVVEATIRTATWGDITEHGKVSKAEREGLTDQKQRLNYVARLHPVEIAKKRALARAERFAFGQDAVIDDDQAEDIVRTVVEERKNPERIAANAAEYDRIYGSDEDHTVYDLPEPEHESQEIVTAPAQRADLWAENRRLSAEANKRGLTVKALNTRASDADISGQNAELAQLIADYDAGQEAEP